jgi:hypothetical protein
MSILFLFIFAVGQNIRLQNENYEPLNNFSETSPGHNRDKKQSTNFRHISEKVHLLYFSCGMAQASNENV